MDEGRIGEIRALMVRVAERSRSPDAEGIAQEVLFRCWRLDKLEQRDNYYRVAATREVITERRARTVRGGIHWRIDSDAEEGERGRFARPRNRLTVDPPDDAEAPTSYPEIRPLLAPTERQYYDDAVAYNETRGTGKTPLERVRQNRRIARIRNALSRRKEETMPRPLITRRAARSWAITVARIDTIVISVSLHTETGLANLEIDAFADGRLRWTARRPARLASGPYGLLGVLSRFLIAIAEMSARR